ncbi:hypothetical protein M569_07050, partial [Genlisea aurea]
LRHSGIPVGFSHYQDISNSKESFLQEISSSYSCSIFSLSPDSDILNEVSRTWEGKGHVIHVVSSQRENFCSRQHDSLWLNVLVVAYEEQPFDDPDHTLTSLRSKILINKIEELPLLICQLYKKSYGDQFFMVGYVMKPSREEDFLKRGAFPLQPTQNGLIFMPLSFEVPLLSQLCLVDFVLHKATDEILAVDLSSTSECNVTFTRNLLDLQRCMNCQPNCCFIDPIDSILPLLDRLKIQQILSGLETLSSQGGHKIRAPHFLKLNSFEEPYLEQRMAEANLSLPNIVKPQVACGVSNAHSMAIVFSMNQYKSLNVPLPSVIQEYVDHSSLLYKFYALGNKKFYAVKKSIPNVETLRKLFTDNGSEPLYFNSLSSLPVVVDHLTSSAHSIDLELVSDAADWLRRVLNLTVIGFDVVVQENTGDHVIVDLNYLPSFKEIPDDVAIPAFWDAIKEKIISIKSK